MTIWTSHVEPLDAIRIIGSLNDGEVRFVLVGGLAALVHGYTGLTQDADTVPAYDEENLERLCRVLVALGASLYAHPARTDLADDGSPPEASDFAFSPAVLRRRTIWQFATSAGPLDVLFAIDGPGGYESLAPRASIHTIAGHEILVAALDDLIESKETAGRDKDLRALGELRRLRRESSRD